MKWLLFDDAVTSGGEENNIGIFPAGQDAQTLERPHWKINSDYPFSCGVGAVWLEISGTIEAGPEPVKSEWHLAKNYRIGRSGRCDGQNHFYHRMFYRVIKDIIMRPKALSRLYHLRKFFGKSC